jgi:inorganic pyrophosphatase
MSYAPVYRDAKSFLGKLITVQIDRPCGSLHPHHGFVYAVNYGFIEGIPARDGEFLDAYVLGVTELLKCFHGRCIAVIHRTDDEDDKLVVVPDSLNLTDEQIKDLTNFQEQFFQSIIIRG